MSEKERLSRSAAVDPSGMPSCFEIPGRPASVRPYGSGHIHETYRVRMRAAADPGYILQRINTGIFPDVPRLMDNIMRVTGHLRYRLAAVPGSDPGREVLTVIPARDGRPFHRDEAGEFWRCFRFIAHQELGERPREPRKAFEAGRVFGRFIDLLDDMPPASLHEVIPRFHDAEFRLQQFRASLQADPLGRRAGAAAEADFIGERAGPMRLILDPGRSGRLRVRVTHNDTKFNNVLFDAAGRGLCLIDLDTVMPGCAATDFGDAVRSAASTAREDEIEPAGIRVDLNVFRELSRGFLFSLGPDFAAAETERFAFGAKLLAFLVGTRFLTDHLTGDRYFRIARPGHNLQRARAQFALLADMERNFERMQEIVAEAAAEIKKG